MFCCYFSFLAVPHIFPSQYSYSVFLPSQNGGENTSGVPDSSVDSKSAPVDTLIFVLVKAGIAFKFAGRSMITLWIHLLLLLIANTSCIEMRGKLIISPFKRMPTCIYMTKRADSVSSGALPASKDLIKLRIQFCGG